MPNSHNLSVGFRNQDQGGRTHSPSSGKGFRVMPLPPPFQHDPELPVEDFARTGVDRHDLPLLAQPIMVSNDVTISLRHSTDISSADESADILPEREPSVNHERVPTTSRVETLRSGFRRQGLPEKVADGGLPQWLHTNPPGTPGRLCAINGTIIPCLVT